MRRHLLAITAIAFAIVSCSNPNKPYTEKIQTYLSNQFDGLDINYQSKSFSWIDTVYVADSLESLKATFDEGINMITNAHIYVPDITDNKEQVFSKAFITKGKYEEIRNWEDNYARPKSLYSHDGYPNYIEFAKAKRTESEWLEEFSSQIEQTDSLLNVYNELEDGNLIFINNLLWYYKRIGKFYNSQYSSPMLDNVSGVLDSLNTLNHKINELSRLPQDQVIFYVAKDEFTIDNPRFNGTEQSLKATAFFDNDNNVVRLVAD